MKFTLKDSNVNIEVGAMITLAFTEEETEEVKTAHLLVVRAIMPIIPLPAYQLVNLDDSFVIPNLFENLQEVEEFIGVLVEEKGHKLIRVTESDQVNIVLEQK